MKNLVFFSGKFLIDQHGASAVVALNLFPESPSELSGAIIGVGQFAKGEDVSPSFTQINLLHQYLQKSIVFRAIAKICRKYATTNILSLKIQRKVDEWLSVLADKLAAEQLTALLWKNPEIKIALGYTGESFLYGQAAKTAGRLYAVHSQFCHPHVQNKLVADAYKSIGLEPPPISPTRLHRQLATLELADIIWCPSEFVRQSLVDNGVPKEKTFVAYLGVDVNSFHVPEGTRRPDDPFLILFVGNVGVQKGVHVLLDALIKANILNITMVFNGSADVAAQQLIQEYSSRLIQKGITIHMDPGDPRRYHKKASVFVLPSVHDSYGIVVVEAMAAGLPVIISDNVGAKEIVRHGKNGFVFPAGNSEKLAAQIEFFYINKDKQSSFGRVSSYLSVNYDVKSAGKDLETKFKMGLVRYNEQRNE